MLKDKFDQKLNLLKKSFVIVSSSLLACVSLTIFSAPAFAADGTFSLGGHALIVNSPNPPQGHPKAIELASTCGGECLRGGSFGTLTTASVIYLPDRTMKLSELYQLSADYKLTAGDCAGGSPRFEVGLDLNGDAVVDKRLFIYFGPLYNFIGCNREWLNTSNVATDNQSGRIDASQLGGRFYSTYTEALSLAGDANIGYIIIVMDGSWWPYANYFFSTPNQQAFHFDRVRVNNDLLNAVNAPSLAATELQGPTIARLNIAEYVSGKSAPRSLYGMDSYLGRRFPGLYGRSEEVGTQRQSVIESPARSRVGSKTISEQ